MTNLSKLKRLSLAAALALSALGTFAGTASADILPDGNGGALCKGSGSCVLLQAECKGKYTDGTQTDGTVYGKCSKTMQVAPGAKLKMRTN